MLAPLILKLSCVCLFKNEQLSVLTTTKHIDCCANDVSAINIKSGVALNTVVRPWDVLLLLLVRLTLNREKKLQIGRIDPAAVGIKKNRR